jgi:hypothetical protein
MRFNKHYFIKKEFDDIIDSSKNMNIERLKVKGNYFVLDIEHLNNKNKVKTLQYIFRVPEDVIINHHIIDMWIEYIYQYDVDNMLRYFTFFKDRGYVFNLKQLNSKYTWEKDEKLRRSLNDVILKSAKDNQTTRIMGEMRYRISDRSNLVEYLQMTVYSWAQCVKSPNGYHNLSLYEYLVYINSYIDDLIEWNILFATPFQGYNIANFEGYIRSKYYNTEINVDDTVKRVDENIKIADKITKDKRRVIIQYISEDIHDYILMKYTYTARNQLIGY